MSSNIPTTWFPSNNRALSILDASNNRMFGGNDKTGITAWADVLKASSSITELNLAKNSIDAADATILAPAISDNGAISSVNVLFNDIGTEQAQALANVLKEHATLKSLCGNKGNETELDMSGKPLKRLGAEGVIMLAPEIFDNGALSVLSLKKNSLCTKDAGKALAQALAGNTTLRELDVSDNQSPAGNLSARDGPGFAQELAVGIRDNGAISYDTITRESLTAFYMQHNPDKTACVDAILANGKTLQERLDVQQKKYGNHAEVTTIKKAKGAISKFTFSGDHFDSKPVTMETSMVEADFGGKGLGLSGAIMVAAFLPKCT
jgi:Ran GTPase-activating protein (RanGAP) involved in mRNA processing and transport